MTKRKKPEDFLPTGRPTKYKPEYVELASNYCLLGAKDAELASFFGVSESTLNLWKQKRPEFSESLKAGKGEADAKVAQSLYRRALGYEHPEDKIFNDNGKPLIVPTIKHYPPDTTAAIFWLKNRQSQNWRDVSKLKIENENPDDKTLDKLLERRRKKDEEIAFLQAGLS